MMPVCLYLYQLGTCEALHAVMRHSFDTGLSVPELLDFIVLSLRESPCLQETVARDSLPCLRESPACKRQFALSSRESPRLQETAAFAAPRRTAGRSARAQKQVARVPQVLWTCRERDAHTAQLAHPAERDFQVVWLIRLIKAAA